MRAFSPLLLRAAATALLLLGAALLSAVAGALAPPEGAFAILLVVLSTNVLGDALVERLAARRAAR